MNCKTVLKVMTGLLLIIALGINAFPRWLANGSGKGFDDTGEGFAAVSLEVYVVEGAGYFLDSYANALLFMKHLESMDKNAVNDTEAVSMLNNALRSMEKANAVFKQLKFLADVTPYKPAVTDALCKFDYEAFQAAYGIDDNIFDRVRDYLGKGDIRAVYGDIVTDTGTIAALLKQVKEQVDAGIFPSTWDVWKLDRAYSDSQRFGQYAARVFDALGLVD